MIMWENIRDLIVKETKFTEQFFSNPRDLPQNFPNRDTWTYRMKTRSKFIRCGYSFFWLESLDDTRMIKIVKGLKGESTAELIVYLDFEAEFDMWKKEFIHDFKVWLSNE